jgi:hypothetical protein
MHRGKVGIWIEKIDRLFADTLEGGSDSDQPWKAIHALRRNGYRIVFDRAAAWCSSSDPLKRARAAAILSQLGQYERRRYDPRMAYRGPEWMFRSEGFALITSMLAQETDDHALESEISALGHIDNPSSVPFIIPFANHANENVRFSVAFALGSYHEAAESTKVLQNLMEDSDRDVRDWAIFGLGVQGNADSEEIRLKFIEHLDDPFLDARIEAAAALGKRRDARLAKPLIRMLKKEGALNGITEAARELLEMSEDPKDWFEEEYIAAIEAKFIESR